MNRELTLYAGIIHDIMYISQDTENFATNKISQKLQSKSL